MTARDSTGQYNDKPSSDRHDVQLSCEQQYSEWQKGGNIGRKKKTSLFYKQTFDTLMEVGRLGNPDIPLINKTNDTD